MGGFSQFVMEFWWGLVAAWSTSSMVSPKSVGGGQGGCLASRSDQVRIGQREDRFRELVGGNGGRPHHCARHLREIATESPGAIQLDVAAAIAARRARAVSHAEAEVLHRGEAAS